MFQVKLSLVIILLIGFVYFSMLYSNNNSVTPTYHKEIFNIKNQELMYYSSSIVNSSLKPTEYTSVNSYDIMELYQRGRLKRGYVDIDRPFYKPWPITLTQLEDLEKRNLRLDNLHRSCYKYNNTFALDSSFADIALASYPGSGNTWFRHLMENVMGVFTGCRGSKPGLVSFSGFYGTKEPTNRGRVSMYKTHALFQQAWMGAVILIRDPFEAMIARRNFGEAGKTEVAEDIYFQGTDWDDYVDRQILNWFDQVNSWAIASVEVKHFLFYESLVQDPEREVRKVLDFLHWNPDEQRIKCTFAINPDGDYKRIVKSGKARWPFSNDQSTKLEDVICKAHRIIKNVDPGSQGLPLQEYLTPLNAKYYSTDGHEIPKSLCTDG